MATHPLDGRNRRHLQSEQHHSLRKGRGAAPSYSNLDTPLRREPSHPVVVASSIGRRNKNDCRLICRLICATHVTTKGDEQEESSSSGAVPPLHPHQARPISVVHVRRREGGDLVLRKLISMFPLCTIHVCVWVLTFLRVLIFAKHPPRSIPHRGTNSKTSKRASEKM